MSKFLKLIACVFFVLQNISCGTLGGLDDRVFLVSKEKIENAIDSFYTMNPTYVIPAKWEQHNDWSKRGYDFLESRIFYFKSSPEEMYYVSFVGTSTSPADTFTCTLAIRAVFKEDEKGWYLEKDLDRKEKKRIEARFDNEIVSKIEVYANAKAKRE
ncbi:hypothetical protein FAZ19_15815 [Sphingobacterium alkalisoli]|uniref:DUF4468 domain-containing protein n=1 Tax=Sphingobacterium alkalisoli TaxID=1874115 RepID=A0A4U0GXH9_9SPHI|nr:hypothetical protein [Sphingobacterium alkalisoli]TJY63736.1 hypothetical protein FAZ19_15815 [Sphingobacterium alkalisoli]